MASATYDGTRSPRVTITDSLDPETGQPAYVAEITIVGVDPSRGTTAEERSLGILQLSLPITVAAPDARNLVARCKRAASSAVHATPGQELDIVKLVSLEFLTARSVRAALRKLSPGII